MRARMTDFFLRRPFGRSYRLTSPKRMSLALAAIFWSVTAWAAPPQASPSIALTNGGIAISGITPGASAVVLRISREKRGYAIGYVRRDYLLSADALGNAQMNLASVPPISVWCVVDLQTGTYAMTAPSGYPVRRIPFPTNGLRAASNGQLNRLRLKHDFLEILWVRPGVGAWQKDVGDGGASDDDHGLDGHISIGPEQMEAIGGSPLPPNHFLPSDTFILVDPDTMELLAIPESR